MRAIYNFLFTIFFLLSSPYYFFRLWRRGNWQQGFQQRFGIFDTKIKQTLTNRQIIWLHAVSVGEMNVCMQLISALQPRLPNLKMVVSTTTTTGMGELQKRLPLEVTKIYFPIDRRAYVARALSAIHPSAIILVESEIWPNFIWRASKVGIPLFLVNARLSDRSYPRYRRFAFIFSKLFRAFTFVGAQNQADAERLRKLGCGPQAVQVVGNLKFDSAVMTGKPRINVPEMLAQLGVPAEALILVAGSTHAGEEKILAQLFIRLRKQFPKLFLVLVPRHFERANEVGEELARLPLKFVYRSELEEENSFGENSLDCLLVDSTGELRYFYEFATVVFVGKSLQAKGGQNPIEPAALGKPVVFGPNMQNFTDVARTFVSQGGAVQARDVIELEQALGRLLGDRPYREELGRKAKMIVAENQGAAERTADLIVDHLRGLNTYIAPRE